MNIYFEYAIFGKDRSRYLNQPICKFDIKNNLHFLDEAASHNYAVMSTLFMSILIAGLAAATPGITL